MPGVDRRRDEFLPFIGPPATLLVWRPLARLPYATAAAMWLTLLAIGLLALILCALYGSRERITAGVVSRRDRARDRLRPDHQRPRAGASRAARLRGRDAPGHRRRPFGTCRDGGGGGCFRAAQRCARARCRSSDESARSPRSSSAHSSPTDWVRSPQARRGRCAMRAQRSRTAQQNASLQFKLHRQPSRTASVFPRTPRGCSAWDSRCSRLRPAPRSFSACANPSRDLPAVPRSCRSVAAFVHEHDLVVAYAAALWCALRTRGATRVVAFTGTLLVCVDWLGLAQRPTGIAQSALLALAAAAAFAALAPSGEPRASRAILPIGALFAVSAWLAIHHPAPVWPGRARPISRAADREHRRGLAGRAARERTARGRPGLGVFANAPAARLRAFGLRYISTSMTLSNGVIALGWKFFRSVL